MNALSTELWRKILPRIPALGHECSINWTMKQKDAWHPRPLWWMLSHTDTMKKKSAWFPRSLWWMLSPLILWRKSQRGFLVLCDEWSINRTMKQPVHSTSLPYPHFLLYTCSAYSPALLWLQYSLFSSSSSQEVDQRAILSSGIAWAGVTNPWGLPNFPSQDKWLSKTFSPSTWQCFDVAMGPGCGFCEKTQSLNWYTFKN